MHMQDSHSTTPTHTLTDILSGDNLVISLFAIAVAVVGSVVMLTAIY